MQLLKQSSFFIMLHCIGILTAWVFVLPTAPARALQTGVNCTPITLAYSRIEQVIWKDDHTALIESHNGSVPGDLTPPRSVWYEYDFAVRTLQELPQSPLETTPLPSFLDGIVSADPRVIGDVLRFANDPYFIYPRIDGDQVTYWVYDSLSDAHLNTGVTVRSDLNTNVLWAADRQAFIIGLDTIVNAPPTLGVTRIDFSGGIVTTVRLDTLPLWVNAGLSESLGFLIAGFRPDGSGVILQSMGITFGLPTGLYYFSLNSQVSFPLSLSLRTADLIETWLNNDELIVFTQEGLVVRQQGRSR